MPKTTAFLFFAQSPVLPEIYQPADSIQGPHLTDLREQLRQVGVALQSSEHARNAEAFIRDYLVNRTQWLRERSDEIENPQPKFRFRMPM